MKDLFYSLYKARTETELHQIIQSNPVFAKGENWKPLGGNENLYAVIENQQASPIAALIEKITNSIDALLTKKCHEARIDPKSKEAPLSMEKAVAQFYPNSNKWDLSNFRKTQSKEIQIIADGPKRDTSLVIYDNGEGQHPEKFEETLLSLVRGNKKDIPFVQGKYNMGGSGAIVFCGKKGYQLIASKRWDGTGEFGFTITRERPIPPEEQDGTRTTWYEYFVLDDKVPSFPIKELGLGLHDKLFTTGTIIKLYSYQMEQSGAITHKLHQNINEYLFQPALPILLVDNKERYPNDKVLELPLFGLKKRLEAEKGIYVSEDFSIDVKQNELFGQAKITCYVFNSKVKDKDVKKTRDDIRDRYFKNGMCVHFSLNGQVHGYYTQEFITRSLQMNILRNHLLIHVDCTHMKYSFYKELFMASRDRLKHGDETGLLRSFLTEKLKRSRLQEIVELRKNSISMEGGSTRDLIRDFTKSLPKNSELFKLLDDSFDIDVAGESNKRSKQKKKKKTEDPEEPFQGKRFPSFFRLEKEHEGETPVAQLPLGGEKTLKFQTDVENAYFDRVDDPGKLEIALVNFKPNETEGGTGSGQPKGIEELLNWDNASPKDGIIKVALGPKSEVQVGDAMQLKVTLNGAGDQFDAMFWVKIADHEQPKESKKKEDEEKAPKTGLPDFYLVYEELKEGDEDGLTWDQLSEQNIDMKDFNVMYPMMEGEKLERVYINMDSHVLLNFKNKVKNINLEQMESADKKYIASVYFHTLFLYTITRKRGYQVRQSLEGEPEKEVDLSDYLRDIFDNYYSEFILNFGGMNDVLHGLGD